MENKFMNLGEWLYILTADSDDIVSHVVKDASDDRHAVKSLPVWIDLIPAGVFNGRDGRGPYRNQHPQQVIAAILKLGMTAGLPIDFDHAIELGAPQGQPAPAAGWIKELRLINGIIQGRVEWTAAGKKALMARLYRYISPVFEFSGDGSVQRLLRAAVTNNPNLFLTAIASAEGGAMLDSQEHFRRVVHQLASSWLRPVRRS
jgi:phage I-like protein